MRARAFFEARDWDSAAADNSAVLERNPSDEGTIRNRGACYDISPCLALSC